ncbi:GNAT family acetyltransferase [Geminicoccus roseus]|uniref:GNAT family acetyltransferase n=1 Tax=Geminicoccus roseus TaxID=404900 RepID=UPI000421AB8C|nr:GNAT family acetyltransferase [Geminicoccus roseus]
MTDEPQESTPPPGLTVRPATAADEPHVIALWRACGLVTSYNDPSGDFRFARAKAGSDVLVGLGADRMVVGSVMVGHDGHRGWIYYLAANPGHRGQGVGRSMVEAAEHWLKGRGVPKVMLLVRETNMQVVGFYRHLGFEEVPRVVMQKWLPGDRGDPAGPGA